VEFIRRDDVKVFANAGVTSQQLLFPENSTSSRVAITRVLLSPGAVNPRHRHATSEQVWVALSGSGLLLLADDSTAPFAAGDIVRFEDGEVHGLENTGSSAFEYLSVTAPPLNFRAAYAAELPTKR
jgi:quercetin dioxygenase-like cupin family protein